MAQHQQQPNGIQQQPNVLSRLLRIPLVEESLGMLVGVAKSTSFTAFFYTKGEHIVNTFLNVSKPIQDRLPLAYINKLANGCLDKAEHMYPRAFEIHSDELFAKARQPADQAYETFNKRVIVAQQSLADIQQHLSTKMPSSTQEAQEQMQHYLGDMNKTKDNILAQLRELPNNAQERVKPLVEELQAGMNDVSKELSNSAIPVQERAQNAGRLIKERAAPALRKAQAIITEARKQQPESYAEVAQPN